MMVEGFTDPPPPPDVTVMLLLDTAVAEPPAFVPVTAQVVAAPTSAFAET
jgi:hypothetical protein